MRRPADHPIRSPRPTSCADTPRRARIGGDRRIDRVAAVRRPELRFAGKAVGVAITPWVKRCDEFDAPG